MLFLMQRMPCKSLVDVVIVQMAVALKQHTMWTLWVWHWWHHCISDALPSIRPRPLATFDALEVFDALDAFDALDVLVEEGAGRMLARISATICFPGWCWMGYTVG